MKKLTGVLVGLAFLLCAFTVQAAQEIDVSVPSAGEACSNDLDCADGEFCINDICSAATPCTNDLSCGPDEECIDEICVPSAGDSCSSSLDCAAGEVCIDAICVQGECETDADCDDGLFCDTDALMCVECSTIVDCAPFEYCTDNGMCKMGNDCGLKIKGKRIKISKWKNSKNTEFKVKMLRWRGNENFATQVQKLRDDLEDDNDKNDQDQLDFDPLGFGLPAPVLGNKNHQVKFWQTADTDLDLGFYYLSVGSCVGEIELY